MPTRCTYAVGTAARLPALRAVSVLAYRTLVVVVVGVVIAVVVVVMPSAA